MVRRAVMVWCYRCMALIDDLLERIRRDGDFSARLRQDPGPVLFEFDLTADDLRRLDQELRRIEGATPVAVTPSAPWSRWIEEVELSPRPEPPSDSGSGTVPE